MTSFCGSLNGSGRSKMALAKLKIAVFAPMPSASVSTATAVKPGFFSSWRKANLISFITESDNRIDPCRAARGQPARHQRHKDKNRSHAKERQRVGCLYFIELI